MTTTTLVSDDSASSVLLKTPPNNNVVDEVPVVSNGICHSKKQSPPPTAAATVAAAAATAAATTAATLCDGCHKKAPLYVCPRCQFRSCSLECCVAHKKRLHCNGKRDRVAYTRSMTDEVLRSDYHFLEDVWGTMDASRRRLLRIVGNDDNDNYKRRSTHNSSRDRRKFHSLINGSEDPPSPASPPSLPPHPLLQILESNTNSQKKPSRLSSSSTLASTVATSVPMVWTLPSGHSSSYDDFFVPSPGKWRALQRLAWSKGIRVVFMPEGMQRRALNRSYIKHHQRTTHIYWTVEWIVHHNHNHKDKHPQQHHSHRPASPQRVVSSQCCGENENLWSVLLNLDLNVDPPTLPQQSESLLGKAVAAAITVDSRLSSYRILLKQQPQVSSSAVDVEHRRHPFVWSTTSGEFVEVSPDATLASICTGTTVIEFPTLHVVPVQRLSDFPRRLATLNSTSTSTSSNNIIDEM